jgi:hypothetical protein
MKKTLLITGVLLALTASVASAAGINMYWTDCGPAGATNKAFLCNTNTGNHDLFLSFDPTISLPSVNGNNQYIHIQSASPTLPQWWQLKNVGSCRALNMTTPTIGPGSCADTWQGQENPGIAAYLVTANSPTLAANEANLVGSNAASSGYTAACDPGTEYFSMGIRINSGKTVGSGACAGCQEAVCLVLNKIIITQPAGSPGGTIEVDAPLTSNYATWQGGAVGGLGCPGETPTVNRTWGQLKSIYR